MANPEGGNAAELKRRNLIRIASALRTSTVMSRRQLADQVGLAVPSAHRLVAELIAEGWVETTAATDGVGGGAGRPTTWFRLRDERAAVVGVDVGSETTRMALASLSGRVERVAEVPTVELRHDLGGRLSAEVRALVGRRRPLAGAGVGVPSVVDATGVLVGPWQESEWADLPLGAHLRKSLGCPVSVAQDNHLSALAESSPHGTAPGARSVVVVELGIGIGAGMVIDSQLLTGASGGFGRMTGWPCTPPRGAKDVGNTLGELITAGGLVGQYRARGGHRAVGTGAALFAAVDAGDRQATRVIEWAVSELRATLVRIGLLVDPEVLVVGGRIGRSLCLHGNISSVDLGKRRRTIEVRPSALGVDAVMTGGLLAAANHVEEWFAAQVIGA